MGSSYTETFMLKNNKTSDVKVNKEKLREIYDLMDERNNLEELIDLTTDIMSNEEYLAILNISTGSVENISKENTIDLDVVRKNLLTLEKKLSYITRTLFELIEDLEV